MRLPLDQRPISRPAVRVRVTFFGQASPSLWESSSEVRSSKKSKVQRVVVIPASWHMAIFTLHKSYTPDHICYVSWLCWSSNLRHSSHEVCGQKLNNCGSFWEWIARRLPVRPWGKKDSPFQPHKTWKFINIHAYKFIIYIDMK